MRTPLTLAIALLLSPLAAVPAHARQVAPPVRPDSLNPADPSHFVETRGGRDTLPRLRWCDYRTVTGIDIRPQLPNLGGVFKRYRVFSRLVSDLHVTTREEVVRRILVLGVGDRCSELRRAESERLLRAQPFLADAQVVARDDGAGGVRLDVVTWDELSLVAGGSASASGPELTGVKLGNMNLGGDAMAVSAEWRQGFYYRDLLAGRFQDYQIFGRPYQLALEGARRPLGRDYYAEFSHPYFTDLQRIAWRVGTGEIDELVSMRHPDEVTAAVGLRRRFWDVGGILRIGIPGRLSMFGASLSSDDERPDAEPVVVTDTGIVGAPDSVGAALRGRYLPHRSARVNALWGVRSVRFLRVTGFDALRGPQDMRIGFQFGAMLGRSLPVLGSDDDDIFLSSDIYIANGSRRSFLALQARGEGREDGDTRRWDGVLTSGRLAWYLRSATFNTIETSAEWSGGYRVRVPFQLGFSDPDGGVRGYRDSRLAGAHRAVLRIEDRLFLGTVKGTADAGLAFFVDGGRLWAGDVPFGTTTRTTWGAGIGLLAAVPPRSKRLWRVDVARALSADPDARWEVRLSSGDFTRRFYLDPRDMRHARERTVPQSVFTWP